MTRRDRFYLPIPRSRWNHCTNTNELDEHGLPACCFYRAAKTAGATQCASPDCGVPVSQPLGPWPASYTNREEKQ